MDIILRVIYHNFLPCSSLEGIFWEQAEALLNFAVDKWELVEVRRTNSNIRICEFRALRRKDSKAQHKLPPAP